MTRIERIGSATLYLADCLDVLPDIGNADCAITDPPYSISTPGVARWEGRYGRTPGDLDFFDGDADWRGMSETVGQAVSLVRASLAAHGSAYVWCGHRQFGKIVAEFEEAGWNTRFLVWKKKHPVPAAPRSGWGSGAELCVYAYRPGRRWTFDGCNPFPSNVFEADGFRFGNPDKVDHPTQKPLSVIEPMIMASSHRGETILDPFMGSGTTGVACARLGRRFIGIEIHKPYFDIACKRIEQTYRQRDLFVDTPTQAAPTQAPLL